MSLSIGLYLQNESSVEAVAETLLGPVPAPDSVTGGYHGHLHPGVYVQVLEMRPQRWDPVVTDLGVDYTLRASFQLEKEAESRPQVRAIVDAAESVRRHHGGSGALLYERDFVILRWSRDGLVVNEGSTYTPDALEVVQDTARLEPIPWA